MALLSLSSNVASLQAQRRLSVSTTKLSAHFERLSSGLRIGSASDDAAGLAISSLLNLDGRVYGQAIRNANDAVSTIAVAEGALDELSLISTRQLELAAQAANGVLTSNQRRALQQETNALTREFNRIIQTTHFNGRALLDLAQQGAQTAAVQVGYGQSGSIGIQVGSQASREACTSDFIISGTLAGAMQSLASGDVNGDSIVDVIAGFLSPNCISISLGRGDGSYDADVTTASLGSWAPSDLAIGDVNGDGVNDIVACGYDSGAHTSRITLTLGSRSGVFSSTTVIGTASAVSLYNPVSVVDLNNDGKKDIVAQNHLYLGNGTGTFQQNTFPSCPSTYPMPVDVNNDGKLDFLASTATGAVGVMLGNGDGTFKSFVTQFTAPPSGGVTAEAMDFDLDGNVDLLAPFNGSITLFWRGRGDGTFESSKPLAGPSAPVSMTASDLNDDGLLDALVQDGTNGDVWRYINDGNGSFISSRIGSSGVAGATQMLVVPGVNSKVAFFANSAAGVHYAFAGLQSVSTGRFWNLMTAQSAREAIVGIREQLERVTSELGNVGALTSRISAAISTLSSAREGFSQAASQITDSDIAADAAGLVSNRILQQSARAVLAQANQSPRLALGLLRSGQ